MQNLLIIFLVIFSLPASSSAAVSSTQKSELSSLIVQFNRAAEQKDISFFVENMPQHLLDSMALRLGKTKQELLNDMKMQLGKQIKSEDAMTYSLKSNDIQYNIASNGQAYALITTVKENKRLKVESQTLAIFENARWHLIYGGARAVQNPAFLLIYPSFEGVELRPDKVIQK
ncbi:hypothetical protein [Bartonella sp. TP]|uniref:hypothetical protein n=1 Tax=Bartonella sp. TP TaxID=3057550 RepID=UPI0025AEF84E|nr:hypothetical protein [Bartonella sp. TP]WJW79795.1 hypothetical protein QVL57_04615 [Bartonella sp. TP]